MAKTQQQKDHNREYQRWYRENNPGYMKEWRDKKKDDPEYRARRCELSRDWYKTEKGRAYRRKERLARYGLTEETYQALLVAQEHKCAICEVELVDNDRGCHVDHRHDTGRVRGLLCGKCNVGIGMFDEDEDLLFSAMNYLAAHAV